MSNQINIKNIELIRQRDYEEAYKNRINEFDNPIVNNNINNYNNNDLTTKDNIFKKTLQFRQELYKQNEELKLLMNENNKKQNELNFKNYMNNNINDFNNINNNIDIDYIINNI